MMSSSVGVVRYGPLNIGSDEGVAAGCRSSHPVGTLFQSRYEKNRSKHDREDHLHPLQDELYFKHGLFFNRHNKPKIKTWNVFSWKTSRGDHACMHLKKTSYKLCIDCNQHIGNLSYNTGIYVI